MDNEVPKFSAANPECIRALVDEYWSWIRSDAYGLLGNMQDAEEVTNDSFLRASKILKDQPELEIKNPRAWLRACLKFANLDFLRRRGRSLHGFSEVSYTELEHISYSEWQRLLEALVDDWDKLPEVVTESNEGVAIIVEEIFKLGMVQKEHEAL